MKRKTSIREKIEKARLVTTHKSRKSFVSGGIITDFIDIDYYFDSSAQRFYASLVFGEKAMGPPGHAHGGAIAAVLDEALGAAAWMNGLYSVTARLQIDYLAAVPIGLPVFVEAWIDTADGKKVTLAGCLQDEAGRIFCKTRSLFIEQGREKFQKMGDMPDDLFIFDASHEP